MPGRSNGTARVAPPRAYRPPARRGHRADGTVTAAPTRTGKRGLARVRRQLPDEAPLTFDRHQRRHGVRRPHRRPRRCPTGRARRPARACACRHRRRPAPPGRRPHRPTSSTASIRTCPSRRPGASWRRRSPRARHGTSACPRWAWSRSSQAVHPVTTVQSEFSRWTRDVQAEVLPYCAAQGVGLPPYSPLGRGFLLGRFSSSDELPENDQRRRLPRFRQDNLRANPAVAAEVRAVADRVGSTPAQIAWPGSSPRASTSFPSRAPRPRRTRPRTRAARTSGCPRPTSPASTPSRPPSAPGTDPCRTHAPSRDHTGTS
ncbi:aldo/keto reductase [Streptomyces corchorusii]